MRNFILFAVFILMCSFTDVSLIKRISDAQFRYEFYTVAKNVTPKKGRTYYWFKGGAIHNTEYGFSGELLHDNFFKYFHSNQLAESGKFKNGLKEGTWKTWYENGTLQSDTEWDSGQKDGQYISYDKTGALVEKGYYSNGLKSGKWINLISKDTLKYRNGKVVAKKEKYNAKEADTLGTKKSKGFFSRIFSSKDSEKKSEKVNNPKVKQVKEKESSGKDKSFFARLFSKKNNTAKAANKNNEKGNVKKANQ